MELSYYQQEGHTFDVAYDLPAEEKLETISSSKLLPAQRFGERRPTVVQEPMSSRPDFVCKSFMEELRRDSVAQRLGEQVFMVRIVNGEIEIYFGPRDWGFNTRTGELLGVGTYLGGQ